VEFTLVSSVLRQRGRNKKFQFPIVFLNENHYHLHIDYPNYEKADMKKFIAPLLLSISMTSFAADIEVKLIIESHRFQPETVNVPAGKKVKLIIENRDATPEEFESHALNREKVILAKSTATIYIGPLTPGSYPFMGEFNQKTAKGVIVAQ
jgi:hypothetical protein